MNIPHCFVSLRYDCTLLLEEGGREGRGRYGNNSRTGVAVSDGGNEGGGSQVRESMEREREEGQRGGMKERGR